MSLINFSGIASGIDSNALIDAISNAARQTKVVPHEKKITELEDTNSTITKLKTKAVELKDFSNNFSTLNGGAVSKLASSSNLSVMSATAANSANTGSFGITVTQLAKNHVLSFNDDFAGGSSKFDSGIYDDGSPAAERTISMTVGTGSNQETISVVLTSATTVDDFVNSFNQQSKKATALLVNTGSAYRVMITSNASGTEDGLISTPSRGIQLSIPSSITESAATDAYFAVDGINGTIVRSSNTINDVITGITFNFQSTGSATINVAADIETTTGRVEEFVEFYNSIVTFIAENNRVTREESGEKVENIFGPLANTRVDDNFLLSLRNSLTSASASNGSFVRIFADLGITTERDGTLKFDKDTFETALSTEPASVNSIMQSFADSASRTGGTIDIFTRFNGLFDTVTRGNETQISNLNDRIAVAKQSIERERTGLVQRFARLESLIGSLQSQQSALTSALSGLSNMKR